MITEKRKQYLKEYRKKNRKKLNEYLRDYLKKTGKKYKSKTVYKSKKRNDGDMVGTNGLGRKYEKIALDILPNSIDCNKDNFHGKWDVEWNGLKIDVKMRNRNKIGYWGFTTKYKPKADYYLLFCVENECIVKTLLVPQKIFGTGISVYNKSKYDKYRFIFSQTNTNIGGAK